MNFNLSCRDGKMYQILMIDDDQEDQRLIEDAFYDYFSECVLQFAADGVEGLDKLSNVQPLPDLILLDINMPRMNGFEFLHCIREQPRFKHLNIMFLTTSSRLIDVDTSREMGAVDFFVKPNNISGLLTLVTNVRHFLLSSLTN